MNQSFQQTWRKCDIGGQVSFQPSLQPVFFTPPPLPSYQPPLIIKFDSLHQNHSSKYTPWNPSDDDLINGIGKFVKEKNVDQLSSYVRKYLSIKQKFDDFVLLFSIVEVFQKYRSDREKSLYLYKDVIHQVEKLFLESLINNHQHLLINDPIVCTLIKNIEKHVDTFNWQTLLVMMNKNEILDLKDSLNKIKWIKLNQNWNRFIVYLLCRNVDHQIK